MRRDSLLFSLLKLLLLAAILFLLWMNFWSSQQVESDLIEVKQALKALETKVGERGPEPVATPVLKEVAHRVWDTKLPNLLKEDPYLTKTLPKQLGEGFVPSGVRRGATIGKPDNLHPFSNWSHVSSW